MSKANERRQSMSSVRTSGPVLGGVLVLLAAWFGWSSYTQWRQDAVAQELEQARDRAVQDISRAMAQQASQLDAVLKQPQVIAALANGDALAAASSIRERFKGAEDVQVLSGDLAAAYDNPKDFGYARLSLLESALVAERAQVHVVRDAKQVRLGVAAAVRLGAQPAVAYARLPLLRLTGPLDAIAVPGSAYLALRQGSYNVAQQGDAVLGDAAETLARPLGNSGLRVAAAVPQRDDGPLGLGAVGCAIVAALLLVIAVLLVLASRGRVALPRRRVAGEPTADEPTFSQSLQHDASLASQARALEADVPPAPPALVPAVQVATEMFRAYDIRGVVGKDLNPGVAALIGQAIGSVMQAQGLREVVVGRDGRLSGPELANGLIDGLRRAGCQVIDIGLAPTPVVYFGAYELRAGSCVAVTGSHNPPDYNGFKIVIGGETLSGAAIAELHQRINEGRLHTAATLAIWNSATSATPTSSASPTTCSWTARSRSWWMPATAWPAISRRACWKRSAPRSSRCIARSTAPSPIIIPTRASRTTSTTWSRWCSDSMPISAWPSMAMPIVWAWSPSRAPWCSRTVC